MTPAEKEVWLSLSKVLNDIISFFPINIIYGVLATVELIMYYNNRCVSVTPGFSDPRSLNPIGSSDWGSLDPRIQ